MSGGYTYSYIQAPPSVNLVLRSDGVVIPLDPNNANYAGYQAWVTAGNKPTHVVVSTALQDAMAVQVQGLTVTSTSAPALNGTYRADGLALAGMQAEANAILLSGTTPTFADGTTSLIWPDRNGAPHTFTVAQFQELIHAMNYFVSQCAQYAAGVGTAPTGVATIA